MIDYNIIIWPEGMVRLRLRLIPNHWYVLLLTVLPISWGHNLSFLGVLYHAVLFCIGVLTWYSQSLSMKKHRFVWIKLLISQDAPAYLYIEHDLFIPHPEQLIRSMERGIHECSYVRTYNVIMNEALSVFACRTCLHPVFSSCISMQSFLHKI